LRAAERRLQANRLMTLLGETSTVGRREADAVLLMGDLNEWRGRSGAIRAFDRRLGPSAAERTFPSWMPVLALDRIYADGPAVLHGVSVYRSPLARLASDHLPLVGTLSWDRHGLWRRDPPRLPPGKRRSRPSVSAARAEKQASAAVATRPGQQSL
jgi:endonuclease/exonuclease/phosphatase family metal-dependent hydrolase